MSIKAVGIAIKLSLEGSSQVADFQTWVFVMVAITCIITQLIYLNKVSTSISSFWFQYAQTTTRPQRCGAFSWNLKTN